MLKSMTGFARVSFSTKEGSFTIETQSVNKRFLETSIFLPKALSHLEIEIKKQIEKYICRGNLILRLNFFPSENKIVSSIYDINLLKKMKKELEKLSKDLGYKKDSIDFKLLIEKSMDFKKKEVLDVESLQKPLFLNLNKALVSLLKMKTEEGKAISADIEKRLKTISSYVMKIEKKAPDAKEKYFKKIKDRLLEIVKDDNEERALKEVCIFAEKIDVTEEIVRLKSHIKQFNTFIKAKEKSIGRKLDFLIQEMLREANTIASKSADVLISKHIVEVKSELEKIKEQIQNIE